MFLQALFGMVLLRAFRSTACTSPRLSARGSSPAPLPPSWRSSPPRSWGSTWARGPAAGIALSVVGLLAINLWGISPRRKPRFPAGQPSHFPRGHGVRITSHDLPKALRGTDRVGDEYHRSRRHERRAHGCPFALLESMRRFPLGQMNQAGFELSIILSRGRGYRHRLYPLGPRRALRFRPTAGIATAALPGDRRSSSPRCCSASRCGPPTWRAASP